MITFDPKTLFPAFMLKDREGKAMCAAIEQGLKDFLAICDQAERNWGDVETMPEWRLDELAWEYNLPYNGNSEVDQKRNWIRDAWKLSRMIGTPAAIKAFLVGYFDDAFIVEGAAYEKDPFHFSVRLSGEETAEGMAWAEKVAALAQNVRSVIDDVTFNGAKSYSTNNYALVIYGTREVNIHSINLDEPE